MSRSGMAWGDAERDMVVTDMIGLLSLDFGRGRMRFVPTGSPLHHGNNGSQLTDRRSQCSE